MKNPLKFDIKLSFTSEILQNNKDNIDLSSYLNNLLNKKINIHLKINLDKIFQQFQKKRLIQCQYNSNNISENDIIINNSIEENNSKESVIELEKEIIPGMESNSKKSEKLFSKNFSLNRIAKQKNSTLVLDLDETLVFVLEQKNDNFSLPQIPFEYYISDENEININKMLQNLNSPEIEKSTNYLIIRPGLSQFLSKVKKYFEEIIIFTSSLYSYAEEIMKIIDPNKIISKIYSRKDCSFYNDIFYKDLNKIKKDLSKTIIIDNYPETYLLQHFNGLPIPPFTGQNNDKELLKLIPLLEKLSQVKDVRNYIRGIVSYDGDKILFDKANELLNIRSDEKQINKNLIKSPNSRKKLVNSFLRNAKVNDTWKKNNLMITEKNKKSNNKTIEHENDEKIICNDINNYFFIEKDNIPLKTIVPSNSKKIFANKLSLNKVDIDNRKIRKKNLILECSYNNKQYNYQSNVSNNPSTGKYTVTETPLDNINILKNNYNSKIINNNKDSLSQNIIINSAKHFKSKSLLNNETNSFKGKKTYQNLNISRNMSDKDNLFFRKH